MTTMTLTATRAGTNTQAIVFAFLLGFSVISMVGVAQSATIHDAAHDVRHASGFPCH